MKTSTAASLSKVLETHADLYPEKNAFTFLAGIEVKEQISYGILAQRARKVAAELISRRAAQRPVLLCFRSGIDFVVSFLACQYAGAVPVALPGDFSGIGGAAKKNRVKHIILDCDPEIILTNAASYDAVNSLYAETRQWLPPCDHKITVLKISEIGDGGRIPRVMSSDTAFLQYSSGSISNPKGVIISQSNLLANLQMIQRSFGNSDDDVGGGWLPHYHDMGLVGQLLSSLYQGVPCYFFATERFTQNPLTWLKVISKFGVTVSGAPSFAYDICARYFRPLAMTDVDLSCWRVAFNGSEPIRRKHMEDFANTYEIYGFSRRAFFPCYGMAEATLLVSAGAATELEGLSSGGGEYCGRITAGVAAKVVHPESQQDLAEGDRGEVAVKGPSVSAGYFSKSGARELPTTADGWYLTGDIGFLRGRELFFVGRKDYSFKHRGRLVCPEDVENLISKYRNANLVSECCVFESHGEISLAIEVRGRTGSEAAVLDFVATVKRKVFSEFGFSIERVYQLEKGTFTHTTSGKLERMRFVESVKAGKVTMEKLATGDMQQSASTRHLPTYREEVYRQMITREVARVLRMEAEEIDPQMPFVDLGLDSMSVTLVAAEVEQKAKVKIPTQWVWEHPTIAALSKHLGRAQHV